MRIGRTTALLGLLIAPALLQAHEGEEHTAPKVAAVPVPGSTLLALGATTEQFELVLKYPPAAPPGRVPLTLFLSDGTTNVPVEGAQIQLQIEGTGVDLPAAPTPAPGIYTAILALPDTGTYELLATVQAGEQLELIPLSGLHLGAEAKTGLPGWKRWGMGLGAFLAAAVLAGALWRRAKKMRRTER